MAILIGPDGRPRYPVIVTNNEAARVVVCRGALATERRLLAELARLAPGTLAELDPPVRVVVPSRSLRLHLLRRLAAERGAVAGLVVQTLGGAAREILERTGRPAPGGTAGFEVLVRRLARGEEALSSELEALTDGYDAVLGAIRDLVDAGFGPDHEDGVLERVDELAPVVPPSNRRRAAALVRVAARALEAAEITGAEPHAVVYRDAAEALLAVGREALPSRWVVIHGFADLTGVAADLLSAMITAVGGLVLLDRVPDPAVPASDDAGNSFLERLEVRLGGLPKEVDSSQAETPSIALVEAPDPEAEARWAAESVRAVIASGVAPEVIGIVARRLDELGRPLRRQLRRLGVPFSGVGARVPGGMLRRKARRLADLIRRGGDAELDLWVEVAEGLEGEVALLLGLRVLSLTRLRDLAVLRPDDRRLTHGVPLPLAQGVQVADDDEPIEGRAARLSSSRVAAAVAAARQLLEVLESWPETGPAAVHLTQSRRLLSALGWDADAGFGVEVFDAVAALAAEFPDRLGLASTEWKSALIQRVEGLGETPIGGCGGGVQVLTVMEARARTFDHLVVCGVNRGVFPRQVVDDAMLPDLVRARLESDVLPEMPVKARSADEERYLFAQLASAAPVIRLSWHLRADGRRTAPSPFVERLEVADEGRSPEPAPSLWSIRQQRAGPRPAYEHAVLAATNGAGDELEDLLTLALVEGRGAATTAPGPVAAERLAAARLDVVRSVERDPSTLVIGPWSGFVGAAVEPAERLWVTYLEGVATCPLRAFLGRRLGVRPLPDPHLGLPDPDHRLVGTVVHEVLERIVTGSGGGERHSLHDALERSPSRVRWPAGERLEELLTEVAERVVFDEGLGGFGLVRLLTARVRPVLEVAKEIEWCGGGVLDGVLAAEIDGELVSPATGRIIGFRADRLDGGPRATDYKSGKPFSKAKQPETRVRHLLNGVRTGRMLQAMAYAAAFPSGEGVGRYLFLRPEIGDTPPEARVVEAAGDDAELREAFDFAVATIEEALCAGAAFPRVREPDTDKQPEHCRHCPVSEACRRDDSRFIDQIVELMERKDGAEIAPLASARRLWWLGVDREGAQ